MVLPCASIAAAQPGLRTARPPQLGAAWRQRGGGGGARPHVQAVAANVGAHEGAQHCASGAVPDVDPVVPAAAQQQLASPARLAALLAARLAAALTADEELQAEDAVRVARAAVVQRVASEREQQSVARAVVDAHVSVKSTGSEALRAARQKAQRLRQAGDSAARRRLLTGRRACPSDRYSRAKMLLPFSRTAAPTTLPLVACQCTT